MRPVTPDGRWTAPAGQFAATIRASDLPGVLSKDLIVEFGTRAVWVEDGEILGELGPGTHTLDSLAERLSFAPRRQIAVVVVREEEIPIELAEASLRTKDGQTVCVHLRVNVQADDVTLFLENVLGARDRLGLDELRSLLVPVLAEQLTCAVGWMTLEELVQADARRRLAATLEATNERLHHYGFRLGPVVAISVRQNEQSSDSALLHDSISQSQATLEGLRRSGRRMIRSCEAGVTHWQPGKGSEATPIEEVRRVSGQEPILPLNTSQVRPVFVNSLGMQLAAIAPGSFVMGSPPDEPDRGGSEDQHLVEIVQPFCLGIFPVTQDEYCSIMGTDPSCFAQPGSSPGAMGSEVAGHGGDYSHRLAGASIDTEECARALPVERVSWDDACEFCRRLSQLPSEKEAGRVYRLPAEAEWEYACRASATTAFSFGPSLSSEQANFDGRSLRSDTDRSTFLGSTTPVGSYPPNAWGLYDMHGNVWEWCADWYSPDYYQPGTNGCWL